jgi:putative Holliday junction resolvase
MNGTVGKAGRRVMEFVDRLKAQVGCPVSTEDERLTTMMSEKVLAAHGVKPRNRKAKLDRMAAQLILQAHLDKRHSAEEEQSS